MELTPKLLTDDVDFRIAFRGYDQDEVDDFLERVAEAVGQLLEQLNQAVDRARSAESRLQKAQLAAATTKPRDEVAEEPGAAAPVAEVSAEEKAAAKAVEADLNDELRRTLVLAQRTADTAIAEAREEAERIAAEAAERAQSLLSEADAEAQRRSDEAKGRLLAEVDELERVREAVRGDVGLLERHLGEQRARVRETVQILRRVVEDPKSFETAPPPELSGVTVPTAEAPDPSERESVPVPPVVESDSAAAPASTEDAGGPAAEEPAAVTPTADEPLAEEPDPSSETPAGGTPVVRPPSGPTAGPDGATGRSTDRPSAGSGPSGRSGENPDRTGSPDTSGSGTNRRPSETATATPPAAPRAAAEAPRLESRQVATRTPATDLGTAEASARHDLRSLFGDMAGSTDAPTTGARKPDARGERAGRHDQGPHTQPVAATRVEEEQDDAFLAELRKAMTEEEPLGPRDGIDSVPFAAPQPEPRTTRFGRRR